MGSPCRSKSRAASRGSSSACLAHTPWDLLASTAALSPTQDALCVSAAVCGGLGKTHPTCAFKWNCAQQNAQIWKALPNLCCLQAFGHAPLKHMHTRACKHNCTWARACRSLTRVHTHERAHALACVEIQPHTCVHACCSLMHTHTCTQVQPQTGMHMLLSPHPLPPATVDRCTIAVEVPTHLAAAICERKCSTAAVRVSRPASYTAWRKAAWGW